VADTQIVTILFCDLVASTERRARLGDDRFDEFSVRFLATLREAIADHQGREVSNAGDGLMVVFPVRAVDAVACATRMHERVAGLDADDPPRLRVGISTGEVAEDGDNYSGMPIVEAARLESAAAPGQTLANAVVRTLVGSRRALRFRDVGALTLKGIPEPLPAVEVLDTEVADDTAEHAPPAVAGGTGPARRARGRRWGLAGLAAVVVVALAVTAFVVTRDDPSTTHAAAAGVPTPDYPVRYVPTSTCPAGIRAVADDATCGKLIVPQDRADPKGKKVELLVSQAPARVPSHAAPSIDVCACENLGNSLTREHAALVHLARRGYEGSDPRLDCPDFAATRAPANAARSDDPAEIAKGTEAFRHCWQQLRSRGIEPSQYNDATAARDVLDLMSALKIERADFTAFGETDAEVLEVMRRAPGAVRSITLENPAPPGSTHFSAPVTDLSGAFGRFAHLCSRDPDCRRVTPDLQAAWRSAHDALDRTPPTLTVANPLGDDHPPVPVLVDGLRAADALAAALSDATTYAILPSAIASPKSSNVVASAALSGGDGLASDAPWGAQASYYCAYPVHTQDADAVDLTERSLPQYVRGHDRNWRAWCKAWPVDDVSSRLSEPVVSAVPALLFRGDLAPEGNPAWIPAIARGLAHAQTAVFPTLGSGILATGPPCLSQLRRAFLANPLRHLPTAACVRQSPPVDIAGA
jgi:class 3 adenylate cyclase